MDEVGIPCYHCRQGVFMSRRFWRYWTDEFGREWGTPREDIDPAVLEEEWRRVEAKQRRLAIVTPIGFLATAADVASRCRPPGT